MIMGKRKPFIQVVAVDEVYLRERVALVKECGFKLSSVTISDLTLASLFKDISQDSLVSYVCIYQDSVSSVSFFHKGIFMGSSNLPTIVLDSDHKDILDQYRVLWAEVSRHIKNSMAVIGHDCSNKVFLPETVAEIHMKNPFFNEAVKEYCSGVVVDALDIDAHSIIDDDVVHKVKDDYFAINVGGLMLDA